VSFTEELDLYLRARFTLIVLVTVEEERALRVITEVCKRATRPCIAWDLIAGFASLSGDSMPSAGDPLTALDKIADGDGNAVYALKDFHEFWKDPRIKRKLRSVAQALRFTRKSMIVLTPTGELPPELRDEAVPIDFPPPSATELEAVLDGLAQTPRLRNELTELGRQKLVQAAVGLSVNQAHRTFSKAVVGDGILDDRDIDLVTAEKKAIIRESRALEFYSVSETPDDVGGLGVLKHWLGLRERAFTDEARRYGLPAPKGIALLGIPGTGKSLTAKMIGGLWHLPLLRLDTGALFGSLVGESEERVRQALRLTEAIAPCVLWIDEIEKSLSAAGNDGGTSQRVFGTILTWMQDKVAPVFVVATANDISALPPELLRRGRFDEVFFLDLPTEQERREILQVHLRKRGREPRMFDLVDLARRSEGYVGAELEQAIIDGMYVAFNDNGRDVTTDDIARAIDRLVPLSRSQRESIEGLREWLRQGRAQSASFEEAAVAVQSFVPLELGS